MGPAHRPPISTPPSTTACAEPRATRCPRTIWCWSIAVDHAGDEMAPRALGELFGSFRSRTASFYSCERRISTSIPLGASSRFADIFQPPGADLLSKAIVVLDQTLQRPIRSARPRCSRSVPRVLGDQPLGRPNRWIKPATQLAETPLTRLWFTRRIVQRDRVRPPKKRRPGPGAGRFRQSRRNVKAQQSCDEIALPRFSEDAAPSHPSIERR